MELLKLLSANEVVAQIICFLILLYLLRRFAWKPILKTLDDRKERIASEFKEIEAAKAETAKVKADYDKKIDAIEDTARSKIHEAVLEGKRMAEAIQENAKRNAEKLIENARQGINEELSKAREALKKDMVDIVITVAEKAIEEKITDEEDRKAVEEFLKRVDNIRWTVAP